MKNGIRKLQLLKLEMLKKFSSVCDKHGIRWFVDGGTLLGTVRHGAFIPWDDDIDVSVPRDEYRKLCNVPSEEFSPYFMQWRETDWEAARGHMQIRKSDTTEMLAFEMTHKGKAKYKFNQGLFMDVFPIDFVPDNWNEIKLGDRLWGLKSGSWNSRGDRALCYDMQMKYDDLASACNCSGMMHTIAVDFNPKRFTPSECFFDLLSMRFEDVDVPVPSGYETRLERLYGKDWRTPKKEATFHGGTFVDLDHPYTLYFT